MIPIIFIHYGHNFYIEKIIRLNTIKGNKIIFLGDNENEYVSKIDGVEFYYYNDFINYKNFIFLGKKIRNCLSSKEGREFLKTDYYRFFAIEKWIILSNFINKYKYKEMFVFDTDTFILDDLNNYDYSKFNFIRYYNIGFQSYIKDFIIHKFCNYLYRENFLYNDNIMNITSKFINNNDFIFLCGDIDIYNNCIFDKCISINSGFIYEMNNDENIIKKISHNTELSVKNIYYDSNNIYLKINGNIVKTLTLNMSWVKQDFFNNFYDFLMNRKEIYYDNVIKL